MKGLFRLHLRNLPLLVCLLLLGGFGARATAKPAKQKDIADTIASNPITTKFAAMLQASPDLITFLSSRGPFTVFVPTDSAFSKMPDDTFNALLRPENKDRLQHIILFHIVNGRRLMVHDLLTVASLLSCEGSQLPVKQSRLGQFVMKAKINHGDIRCENGVIHQIDTLLIPTGSLVPALVPTAVAPPPVATPSGTNAPPVNIPAASTNTAPIE